MTNPDASAAPMPDGAPAIPLPELSRRSFLKLLAASIVVISVPTVSGELTVPAVGIPAAGATDGLAATNLLAPALSARPGDVPLQALPAITTALLQQAFEELRGLGFPFRLEQGSVYQHPNRASLYGLLFQDTLLAPRQQGADIAFTLDTAVPDRSLLFYIIGHSESDGLRLATTVLTAQGQRSERSVIVPREQFATTRGPARHILRNSLLANTWTTASQAGVAAPMLIEHTAWYYDHGSGPVWSLLRGADGYERPQLRLSHSQEYRDSRVVIAGQARLDGWQSDVRTIALPPTTWTAGSRRAAGTPEQGPKEMR